MSTVHVSMHLYGNTLLASDVHIGNVAEEFRSKMYVYVYVSFQVSFSYWKAFDTVDRNILCHMMKIH